jgi:hypothetical protein
MAMGDMDCGDNSCIFAIKKGGMRTNGGCRCLQDAPYELQRDVNLWAQRMRQEVKAAEARGLDAGKKAAAARLDTVAADLRRLSTEKRGKREIEADEHARMSEALRKLARELVRAEHVPDAGEGSDG